MSERYEPYREPHPPADDWRPDEDGATPEPDDWREHTTPGMAPVPPIPTGGPTAAYPSVGGRGYPGQDYAGQGYQGQSYPGQGYPGQNRPGPAYLAPGDPYAGGPGAVTTPDYTGRPVASRRPDALAALLLLLAGVAAGVSLVLHWVHGNDVTGWGLMHRAWGLRSDPGALSSTGLWQPVAAVAGGVILFVLGLLLLVPARAHRTLGVLALLVSLGAGAGVWVALSGTHWQPGRFQIGFWLAVAVPVLGVIGSLKALLTAPRPTARAPLA